MNEYGPRSDPVSVLLLDTEVSRILCRTPQKCRINVDEMSMSPPSRCNVHVTLGHFVTISNLAAFCCTKSTRTVAAGVSVTFKGLALHYHRSIMCHVSSHFQMCICSLRKSRTSVNMQTIMCALIDLIWYVKALS